MSSRRAYLSPTAHSSPGMKRSKMNNKPISRSQSVSVTSESTLSLSDLEDSMARTASIVLTDSDGEPEIFSDAEAHSWHANTGHHPPPLSPRKQHDTQSFPPSQQGNSSSEARYHRSAANSSHQSPSPASHHTPAASSHHPPPINTPPSSDKSTWPGLREATPATLGGPRVTPNRKQKFYVVTNGRTMGVFTQWNLVHESVDKFPSYAQDALSLTLEAALQRWNECWMSDQIGDNNESGRMGRGGVKGMGWEVVPTFYYIIVKGKVPHVTSFLDDAIADAGNHPYREVFIVRDELTALKFLLDKLHDDEILRADF
ncbi:uncharacterized protein ARMOST_13655 [Armillaria ostoyae]|uniref:Ribonuclease H1 N-terminal domain-containing protein n=1 Tax=Armillaria ostoyae TaxID=47428 RepID=A0A284RNH8_ARMOS|nr:uncharacterized protein ARMOST_13655 [Armillaria ostoyae]